MRATPVCSQTFAEAQRSAAHRQPPRGFEEACSGRIGLSATCARRRHGVPVAAGFRAGLDGPRLSAQRCGHRPVNPVGDLTTKAQTASMRPTVKTSCGSAVGGRLSSDFRCHCCLDIVEDGIEQAVVNWLDPFAPVRLIFPECLAFHRVAKERPAVHSLELEPVLDL